LAGRISRPAGNRTQDRRVAGGQAVVPQSQAAMATGEDVGARLCLRLCTPIKWFTAVWWGNRLRHLLLPLMLLVKAQGGR